VAVLAGFIQQIDRAGDLRTVPFHCGGHVRGKGHVDLRLHDLDLKHRMIISGRFAMLSSA
jgi:hypothetical protein